MQRFFKPWLAFDFIFMRSSYAAAHKKSLDCLQNFAMKVCTQTDIFVWCLSYNFTAKLNSCKETTADDEKSLLLSTLVERTMAGFS